MFPAVIRTIAAALLAVLIHGIGGSGPLGAQAGPDQTLTLETPHGRLAGLLRQPATVARPPVILLVSTEDTQELARAMAADGVASVRLDSTQGDEHTTAQWIALLRNDPRFPTVTVLGDGAVLNHAVIAARAARADGVVVRGAEDAAAPEIARLAARKLTVSPGTAADEANKIAAFVRAVPALGRRGTTAARPATPRRSPRRVLLTMLGTVRAGLEWGQPQKRGREIWGTLVKWNEIWMPGADEATTLTTNGPLMIGSLEVPAGDYTLYLVPGEDRFQLVISRDVGQWHTVHDAARELGRLEMTAGSRPDSVEGLTFSIEPQVPGGVFSLSWDTRVYSVGITKK